MEDKLRKFVRKNREEFDTKTPSPELWNRIKFQIDLPKKERKISIHWMWSVAAVILVLFVVGLLWQRDLYIMDVPSDSHIVQTDTTKEHPARTLVEPKTETSTVHIEAMPDMIRPRQQDRSIAVELREGRVVSKTVDLLAMLNDPHSGITRMEGVLKAKELEVLPEELMKQIYHMVNHDPNSNVRIVALELFMAHTPVSEWDEKIQGVFIQQDDPILQLELMQVMATVDSIGINPATAYKLHEITEDPFAIDLVKERAYAVLMKNW